MNILTQFTPIFLLATILRFEVIQGGLANNSAENVAVPTERLGDFQSIHPQILIPVSADKQEPVYEHTSYVSYKIKDPNLMFQKPIMPNGPIPKVPYKYSQYYNPNDFNSSQGTKPERLNLTNSDEFVSEKSDACKLHSAIAIQANLARELLVSLLGTLTKEDLDVLYTSRPSSQDVIRADVVRKYLNKLLSNLTPQDPKPLFSEIASGPGGLNRNQPPSGIDSRGVNTLSKDYFLTKYRQSSPPLQLPPYYSPLQLPPRPLQLPFPYPLYYPYSTPSATMTSGQRYGSEAMYPRAMEQNTMPHGVKNSIYRNRFYIPNPPFFYPPPFPFHSMPHYMFREPDFEFIHEHSFHFPHAPAIESYFPAHKIEHRDYYAHSKSPKNTFKTERVSNVKLNKLNEEDEDDYNDYYYDIDRRIQI